MPSHYHPQNHQYRLLLVEDNETNQQLTVLQLERLGYICDTVDSGRAALDAVEQKQYSLVLMDCQIPDLDGIETTRLMRKREHKTGKHLPIIALTANASVNDRLMCLDAGMDDYLAKPTTLSQLDDKIMYWTRQEMPTFSAVPLQRLVSQPIAQAKELPSLGVEQLPTLDMKAYDMLCQLFGGPMSPKFADTIQLFLDSSASLLKSLREATDNHDIDGVRRAAHTLKSSSASFGAAQLASQCAALERLAREGIWEGIETFTEDMEIEYDLLLSAIAAERKKSTHD
jgi:CheY-like chemotaxis protein